MLTQKIVFNFQIQKCCIHCRCKYRIEPRTQLGSVNHYMEAARISRNYNIKLQSYLFNLTYVKIGIDVKIGITHQAECM